MIIGIESTTDHRHAETKIVRLSSERAALRWMASDGGASRLAWPGSVPKKAGGLGPDDIPLGVVNMHHRLKSAYEMPSGWRMPTQNDWKKLHHEDRRSFQTFQADAVRRSGTPIRSDASRKAIAALPDASAAVYSAMDSAMRGGK